MPSLKMDPFGTGTPTFKDPNQVINATTGQQASSLTPTQDFSKISAGIADVTNQVADIQAGIDNLKTPTDSMDIEYGDSLPDDVLTTDSTLAGAVGKASDFAKLFEDYQARNLEYQNKILALSEPSPELESALADLNQVREDRNSLIDQSENRQASLGSIRGEQAVINREFSRREQTAINKAQLLIDNNAQQISATEKALQFNQQNLDTFLTLQELTTPEIIGQEIDPVTGEVIAFTRGFDGTIQPQIIGSISVPDPEKKSVAIITNEATGQKIHVSQKGNEFIYEPIEGSAGLKPSTSGGSLSEFLSFGGDGAPVDISDPEYMRDLLASTSIFKENPVASEREQLAKFASVIAQTGNLIGTLNDIDTDPVIGYLKGLNPYDFDARAVNAQLQALVPNVARGVYGEVGVLTDTDIRNYMRTLPTLTGTKEQNQFVGLLTLKNAQRAFETTLRGMANSQIDVSGWVNDYDAVTEEVSRLEEALGVGDAIASTPNGDVPLDGYLGEEAEVDEDTGFFKGIWNSFSNFIN